MEKSQIKVVGFKNAALHPDESGNIVRIDFDSAQSALSKSWIDLIHLSEDLFKENTFETLWNLQPEEPGFVMMPRKNPETGKMERAKIPVPRKQQAYLKPYWFSGMQHNPEPMPEAFAPFLEHANSLEYCETDEPEFNEMLVNWYADGNDNIGMHSDDPKQHVKGNKHGFLIYSLTLWEPIGIPRIFRIKPRSGGSDRIDIPLEDRLLVIMGGEMQDHYKHGVPATKKETGRRINITLRQFQD